MNVRPLFAPPARRLVFGRALVAALSFFTSGVCSGVIVSILGGLS